MLTRYGYLSTLLAWVCFSWTAAAQETAAPAPEKIMRASRINPAPPAIDGALNDEAWLHAGAFTGFTQRDPDEGKAATESTTVQIVYDDEAVYIAIQCYDREPDKIVSRLTRRDQWIDMDRVVVNLDPHHDHQTGFYFALGPSGWKGDGILFSDTEDDDTWDGVWEGKASIHEKGWSAEYKIPYHVLRFSDKPAYIWGLNVTRHVSRKKERADWIMVPRGQNAWASRFGHLEGIEGIHPPRHLEVLPFGVSRSSFLPKSKATPNGFDQFGAMGVDLRYGLSSNISLNGTFNPDFGQVEADPSVLNLGVVETFYNERRPFFLEGNAIFNAPNPDIVGIEGPSRLFHSRRIGRAPGRFATPDTSTVIERPDGTTILGAMKVSGKTARRTSFGLVEALTGNEYASIEDSVFNTTLGVRQAVRSQYRVEPRTNFLVGRIQQDIFGNSYIGTTVTAMNGDGLSPAYVASVDGQLKWKKNAYRVFNRFSVSRTGPAASRREGYEGLLYFSKFSGWFGGQVYADARSKEFNANDLGFMDRAGRIQTGAHVYAQIQKPWALARQSGFNINTWSQWNYDRVNLKKGINFNTWQNLKNYWFFNFGVSRDFRALDDLATRGGPVMVNPATTWFWSNLGTDSRKRIQVGTYFSGGRSEHGLSSNRTIGAWSTIRPTPKIQLELNPRYSVNRNFAQWISNPVDSVGVKHHVFGELDSKVLDLTTRATVSLTPDLSLQVYLQTFLAVGNYGNIKELAAARSYSFTPYAGALGNQDFNRRSLKSNVVLRWEYRPGSTLFLVWAQSRSASSSDPSFQPWSSLSNAFTDNGQNIFQVKMNYWFNL